MQGTALLFLSRVFCVVVRATREHPQKEHQAPDECACASPRLTRASFSPPLWRPTRYYPPLDQDLNQAAGGSEGGGNQDDLASRLAGVDLVLVDHSANDVSLRTSYVSEDVVEEVKGPRGQRDAVKHKHAKTLKQKRIK